ncbi:MAG TPA: MATE family efflux transporter [Kofleriaceae bacterium]|jgi:MATE family multidrug resistance protein|nr:MATE family efflux transporter [Kofleriaceae bacterium]
MSLSGSTGSASSVSVALPWTDRPGRALLRLAWPITVSMISFSAMTLTSTVFVAHLGSDQLAGVGLAGVVGFALMCFGIGLLRGAKTLVSQAVGAGRHDRLPGLMAAAIALAVGLGALATIAGQIVAPLLVALSASPRAGQFAAQYLAIRSLGSILVLLYAALREASYGQGDSRSPMRASLCGNAVNLVLDSILILGLGWGVQGAAIAAVCGNFTELALLTWRMRPSLLHLRLQRAAIRDVWAQGVPNGLQFVMEVGSFLILTVLIARMSAVDGAAHQMVLQLVNVSFLPAHALAEAAAVLVGQAVGANRDALVPRVARRTLLIGASYALVCVAVYAVLGGLITRALASGDPALAARAVLLVHVSLAFLVADAANVIARGVLRGASDVRYAAIVGIVTSWLTTPPLTWVLGVGLGLGAVGGWIGLAVEICVGAGLFWLRVLRGGWRPAAAAARRAIAGAAV